MHNFSQGDRVVMNHHELGKMTGVVRHIDKTDRNLFEPEWVGKDSLNEVDLDDLVCITPFDSDFEDLWAFSDQITLDQKI